LIERGFFPDCAAKQALGINTLETDSRLHVQQLEIADTTTGDGVTVIRFRRRCERDLKITLAWMEGQ